MQKMKFDMIEAIAKRNDSQVDEMNLTTRPLLAATQIFGETDRRR